MAPVRPGNMIDPQGGGTHAPESSWEADEQEFENDERLERETVDTTAEIECPHCGESVAIVLDPGGGPSQEYVEDCQVCCRPCRIRLQYDDRGRAEVWVDQSR